MMMMMMMMMNDTRSKVDDVADRQEEKSVQRL